MKSSDLDISDAVERVPTAGQLAPIGPEDLEEDSLDGVSLPAFLDSDPGLATALEELARKQHLLEALAAQTLADQMGRYFREVNACDGMGEVRRMMPAFSYHDIALKEGTYDCYKDKSFNRYLDRKAPETRVRCVAPRSGNGLPLMLGWRAVNEPRFRKIYAESEGPRSKAQGPRSELAPSEPSSLPLDLGPCALGLS